MQVKRQVWATDGDGNSYSTLTAVSSFSGFIQQAGPELFARLHLSFTKAYIILCPVGTNVLEGDTITADGYNYSVRAKQENTIGDNQHIHLIVELDTIPEGS